MTLIFSIILAIIEVIGIGILLNLVFTKSQPEEIKVQTTEIKTVETPVATEEKTETKVEIKPEVKEEKVVSEDKAPESTETKSEENKD